MNKLLFCALLTAVTLTPAQADDMSCGTALVQPGDSIESLIEKCGKPDSTIDTAGGATYWVYRKDQRYQVSTSQGTVSEIKTLYQ